MHIFEVINIKNFIPNVKKNIIKYLNWLHFLSFRKTMANNTHFIKSQENPKITLTSFAYEQILVLEVIF